MTPALGYSLDINKMELASANGNGRKMTEFTTAKRAALAAIQTENVSRLTTGAVSAK
jgi:hypothetical protein